MAGTLKARQNTPHKTMPKSQNPANHLRVDDVEAAFYDALQTADIDKLMACWADEDDIVCVHPGGPRVLGPAAIRAAFTAMFANGPIQVWPERVHTVDSHASVVRSVLERIELTLPDGRIEAWVIATNVYHRTAQGWRMVAHHTSPGTPGEVQGAEGGPQVLH